MQSTIIYYWVYQLTEDKLKLGMVGLAEVIPAVLFSLFSGHFVDLHEKRKMILIGVLAYLFLGLSLFGLTTPFALEELGQSIVLISIYSLVFIGGIILGCTFQPVWPPDILLFSVYQNMVMAITEPYCII